MLLTALVVSLFFGVQEVSAQDPYYSAAIPTSYTVSYGPYSATIPVNDPMMRSDFDNTKCGNNCWGTSGYNHHQRAQDRAREVYEAQREAFWAQ